MNACPRSALVPAALAWALAASACTVNVAPDDTSATAAFPGAVNAHLAAAVEAGSNEELSLAELGQQRAHAAEVKALAAKLVTDITTEQSERAATLARLQITPADSELSKKLTSQANDAIEALRLTDDASFDQAFLQAEVDAHDHAVDTLDKVIIPYAATEDFRDHLQATRTAASARGDEAKKLLAPAGTVLTR